MSTLNLICLRCQSNYRSTNAATTLCPDCKNHAKERACLKCQEKFLSESAGNRLCPKCGESNNKVRVNQLLFARRGGVHLESGD